MPEPESFKLEIDGHTVEGALCLPSNAGRKPVPCVLLCRNLVDHDPAIDQLWDGFIDRAMEQSLAVASFEPRCAHLILDDFDAYALEDYWRDVERVVYHLAALETIRTDPMTVIGYRLGSLAALRLAATHTGVARIGLVSPLLDGRHVSGDSQPDRNGRPTPAHLPKRMLESLNDFDSASLTGACSTTVLILHGAADRTVPPDQSIEYEQLFIDSGVPARLEQIVRADHTFSQPETRQACIDRLVRFCAG